MSDNGDDVVIEPESPDGEQGTKTPEQKIKELRDALKVAEKERDENLTGWQRAKADYVNAKRRFEEDAGTLASYKVENLIVGLLPVLDAFEYALLHSAENESLLTGIQNVYKELLKVVGEAGVVSFSPENEPFDPARHESVETVAVSELAMDNMVTKVHQRGYSLSGRIIRPARVAVGHYQKN